MKFVKTFSRELTKGVWKENPVLIMTLGMCPTLAVTTDAKKGLALGVATMLVMIGTNITISLFKNFVPTRIQTPCYVIIIAGFTSSINLLCQSYLPPKIDDALGIFIPLIAVNCIIFGRAISFASKRNVLYSIADAIGMGLGFTLVLTVLGGISEFICRGSLFDIIFIPGWTEHFMLPMFAPGSFFIVALFLAGRNYLDIRSAEKAGRTFERPKHLGCRECSICELPDDEESKSS